MSTKEAVLSFDAGTSSMKAVLVDGRSIQCGFLSFQTTPAKLERR